MKIELNVSNFARNADLKNATGVGASDFAENMI